MSQYLDELFSLRGRTAVVTGGSSGIGGAIADALCRAGAETVLVARDETRLEERTRRLVEEGGTASWIAADFSSRESTLGLVNTLRISGQEPDILVTAAAVNLRPPLGELTDDDWDLTMTVNLEAPHLLGQRFGPGMAARGWGRIIHIASQQSVRAFGNSGAYGVSKAGVAGLARSQAEAWSPNGVCVNAIAPGFVRTPLTEAVFAEPGRAEAMARRTMIGRNGDPEDFAGLAVFLASNASAYVTGQLLFLDGGFSAT